MLQTAGGGGVFSACSFFVLLFPAILLSYPGETYELGSSDGYRLIFSYDFIDLYGQNNWLQTLRKNWIRLLMPTSRESSLSSRIRYIMRFCPKKSISSRVCVAMLFRGFVTVIFGLIYQ